MSIAARDKNESEIKLSIESISSLRGTDSHPITVQSALSCGDNSVAASDFVVTDTGVSVCSEVSSLKATVASLQSQLLDCVSKLNILSNTVESTLPTMQVFVDSMANVIQISSTQDENGEDDV
jgi:hypothetical protein